MSWTQNPSLSIHELILGASIWIISNKDSPHRSVSWAISIFIKRRCYHVSTIYHNPALWNSNHKPAVWSKGKGPPKIYTVKPLKSGTLGGPLLYRIAEVTAFQKIEKKKKKKLDSVWSTFFEWVSTIYIHGFRSICICRQIDRISEISDWSACVSMQCAPRAPSVGFLFVSSLYHLNKLFEFLSFYNQKTNLSKSRCLKRIQYRLVSWIML